MQKLLAQIASAFVLPFKLAVVAAFDRGFELAAEEIRARLPSEKDLTEAELALSKFRPALPGKKKSQDDSGS